MQNYNSLQYLLDDYPHTLFPLSTTSILLTNSHLEVNDYIYQRVLDDSQPEHSFLSQTKCYASKHGLHLRRTVKLDPIAEFFIYDIVYRNRNTFRKDFDTRRRSFGYRFENGIPVSLSAEYSAFKTAVSQARGEFKYSLKFDIASYFNSLYHHDIVSWFSESGRALQGVDQLGQFLREANSGRTIDCLPQGLYPCKVIGAEFLKFIDNSFKVKSEVLLRFMDDFYLFSNNEEILIADFLLIQRMLGEKGLSVNSEKTVLGQVDELNVSDKINKIRKSLLRVRTLQITTKVSGLPASVESKLFQNVLDEEQIDYLLTLLKDPNIDEADAELVLSLLRDYGQDVLERMTVFLEKFPSLSRNVYNFSRFVGDATEFAELIMRFLSSGKHTTEEQLFWLAKVAEDRLFKTPQYSNILSMLINHGNATTITQAKVLEIPENRFGMNDLREEHLRVGKSDWLAWASAIGSRGQTAISRNHVLSYFAKASPMNKIISDCVKKLALVLTADSLYGILL